MIELVFGGLPPKEGPLSEGYFAIPTVFADTSNDWRLARGGFRAGTGGDPVEGRGRRDPHGQRQPLRPRRLCLDRRYRQRPPHRPRDRKRLGPVNQGLGQSPGHSYGGYKQSGIGREFSLEGMLDSFTQRKNVTVNLNTPHRE
jgi:hypothetical protein